MQQFAGLLQALPRNFAYGLSALIEQQGGAPERRPGRPEAARRGPGGARPTETPRRPEAADAVR